MDLSKALLITHKNCADGSACAILFSLAGGWRENIRFVSPNHRETDEVVAEAVETWPGPIIMADMSISLELAKSIGRGDLYLLDHHKTAIPLSDIPWCTIDKENSRCGAKMLYDWLLDNAPSSHFMECKRFVELIDDHDRWIKAYPESDSLVMLHEILGSKNFIERFFTNPDPTMTDFENYLINLEMIKRGQFIEEKKQNLVIINRTIDGHDVNIALVVANNHQSHLGNSICEDPLLDVDIAIMVGTSISMRASKDCPVDLSKVTKKLGGGGHAKAAGCSWDKILGSSLIEKVIDVF